MKNRVPVVFWLILGLQVAVPLARLGAEKPDRFGWHMFAGVRPTVSFAVRAADGTVDTLSVADVLVHPRQEIDVATELPPRICVRDPDAISVSLLVGGADVEQGRPFPCP